MPRYPWLLAQRLDTSSLPARISALRRIGVPYPPGFENQALEDLNRQSAKIAADLKTGQVTAPPDREIIAVIAYLQRLGTDIKAAPHGPDNKLAVAAGTGQPAGH